MVTKGWDDRSDSRDGALIGAIFVSHGTSHIRHDLVRAKDIPAAVRVQVVKGVGDGIGGGAPPGASDTPTGQHTASIVSNGVTEAARPAVAFAGIVVTAGALISLLVPNIPAEPHVPTTPTGDWPAAVDAAYPDTDAELEPNPTS